MYKNSHNDDLSNFLTDEIMELLEDSTMITDKKSNINIHEYMWIFAQGLATLLATKALELTDTEIENILSEQFQAMMLLKDNPNNIYI